MSANAIPVVLLHGLGRTPASMRPMARRLRRAGWRTEIPGYPSTRLGIAEAVAAVRAMLREIDGAIHLVGHSLGGLIAARLLREGGLAIARVVQLGAPNLGTPAAARLGGRWPLRRLCGPALAELGPKDEAPPPRDEIGAIAATLGAARPHDGAVPRASAWAGAGHRAEVTGLHTLLPLSPACARLTLAFLADGRFPETP